MSRYSSSDEEAIRTLACVRQWLQSGFIGRDQALHLSAGLQTGLKGTNSFFRLVLFSFTAMLVSASLWLIAFLFDLNGRTATALLSMGGAAVCFIAADFLVGRYRLYRFGVEEALAIASVVLLSGGVSLFAPDDFRYHALVGLSVGSVCSLLVYSRFGYVYAATGSILCAALIPFTIDTGIEAQRLAAALVFACTFAVVRQRRFLWGEDFPGDDYGVLQAVSWAGIYTALNLQLGRSYGEPPSLLHWVTYAMIWLLPAAGLWLALKDKDRPFIQINTAIALATLVTNKPYLGLDRKPWDPILFGLLLMSFASFVKRWLASGTNAQRYGFTAARLLAGDSKVMTAIATASVAFQPDVPPPAPAQPRTDFGGGRSGGAGAGGEF
jgi:hypothetical protein